MYNIDITAFYDKIMFRNFEHYSCIFKNIIVHIVHVEKEVISYQNN